MGLWLRRKRVLVLAYHNVVPDGMLGRGDASLHLGLSGFRRQLDLICSACRPVCLGDVLSGDWKGQGNMMAVAITFDDAYRGAISLAIPELEKRGAPATVFVAPGILGDRTLWWDALATTEHGGVPPHLRDRILEEGRGRCDGAREVTGIEKVEWCEMPELMRTVGEEELLTLRGRPGIRVGSHSWSHPSLVRFPAADLSRELELPRAWLRERFGDSYLDVLAYPYGHCSPHVERASYAAGYEAALDLRGGTADPDDPARRFRMARNNVPQGLSIPGLSLRLAGVR